MPTRTISLPELPNEPFLDFGNPDIGAWRRITKEIARVRSDVLGMEFPHIIAAVGIRGGNAARFHRENPSNLNETIGSIHFAQKESVDEAVGCVRRSSDAREWARMPLSKRAPYLRKVADILKQKRFFFIALLMLEIGKQAHLADAEVCEAIDLLTHYAAHAEFLEKLGNALLMSPLGEKNSVVYRPYGPRVPICASIQPWNFPLAIGAGPTAAALVCGHSVIFKPAEQASVIGYFLAQAFYEAGIPADVFHFLPGKGEEVGKALAAHPGITGVTFTGSLSVRHAIRDEIARFNRDGLLRLPLAEQWEKRAYALESGGKNAMIVFPNADPDCVVLDAVESFAGYQGQKCSALSRLIFVDEDDTRFDGIIERLAERVRSLPVGSPEDPKNVVGPLIDNGARRNAELYMKRAEQDGTVLVRGEVSHGLNGYFVPPMVVGELPPDSRILQEEIFGPLLAVMRVRTPEEAIALVNHSRFALTAGIHTRDPERASHLCREIDAGNIYIKRSITGAIPGRQNFGGGKESGNGTKASDLTYLLPFLFPVHISENTMQCGIPIE